MAIGTKDITALGSLCVSLAALVFSVQAKREAQNLDELVFRSETVHTLLKEVHDNTLKATDPIEKTAGCLYAGSLAKAEESVVDNPEKRLVLGLFLQQVNSGLLPQNCVVETLEVLEATKLASPSEATSVKIADPQGGDLKMGQYHALIASYVPSEKSCQHAKEDVEEFSGLLSKAGLSGYNIYIARTVKSNSLAVTVDAGTDKNAAYNIRDIIKSVSPAAKGNTGYDSFVQINSDWYFDGSCTAVKRIGI